MEPGTSPRIVTSKRKIKYRKSSWNVHEFEVYSGEPLFRIIALKMEQSLLLWVGGAKAAEPVLGEVALGLPTEVLPERAVCTTMLEIPESGSEAAALALRVAAGLKCPIFVCSGQRLDRFTAPLLEMGIAVEIKVHPNCF